MSQPFPDVIVVEESAAVVEVESTPPATVEVVTAGGPHGAQGPPGPPGQWVSLTQAAYDALDPPDPDTLYVIVG